jgi:hypothetical protein
VERSPTGGGCPQHGLITAETQGAIEGLIVMRNLAAHEGQEDVSPQRAHEFIALAQGVLCAIQANSKSASRSSGQSRLGRGTLNEIL